MFSYKKEIRNEIVVFRLEGRLFEHSESDALIQDFENHLDEKNNKFVVNLGKLEYMNSSGLNLLINLLTRARNNYGELVICELSDRIKELLVTTKLQNIFEVTEEEEEAIAKLN